MFKYILKLVFVSLILIIGIQLNAQKVTSNAIILNSEIAEEFEITKSNGLRQLVRTIKVKKKIKVLTRFGVDEFNKLYLPTLEDIEFTTLLYDFSGKTIKQDGQVIEIHESEIRETTLPANNKFLNNYSGKVKLIAFKRVNVGDVIEFSYTLRYIRRSSQKKMYFSNQEFLSKNIPIENFSYSIKIPKKNNIELRLFNTNEEFVMLEEDKSIIYEMNLSNIPVYYDEEYSLTYKSRPYFEYLVTNDKINDSNTLMALAALILVKPSRRQIKASLKYNEKEWEEIKAIDSVLEKVKAFQKIGYKSIRTINYYISKGSSYWYPSLKEAKAYLIFFNIMEIDASIILLSPNYNGEIDEKNLGAIDFEDMLISFFDESGIEHFIQITSPYAAIDEIPYKYENTKAVKIKNFNEDGWLSVIDIPSSNIEDNNSIITKNINLFVANDSIRFDVKNVKIMNGLETYGYRKLVLSLDNDSTLQNDQIFLENVIDYPYDNASDFIISPDIINIDEGHYEYTTEYSGYQHHKLENAIIPLALLIPELDYYYLLNHESYDERTEDAYFTYGYSNEIELSVKAPDGYNLLVNDYLNFNFDNEFGTIASTCTKEGEGIRINLIYIFKNNYCSKSDWQKFVNFDREFAKYMSLSVLLIKK